MGRAGGPLGHIGDGQGQGRPRAPASPEGGGCSELPSWSPPGPSAQSRGRAWPGAVVSGAGLGEENGAAVHWQRQRPPWSWSSSPFRPPRRLPAPVLVTRVLYRKGGRWGSRSEPMEVGACCRDVSHLSGDLSRRAAASPRPAPAGFPMAGPAGVTPACVSVRGLGSCAAILGAASEPTGSGLGEGQGAGQGQIEECLTSGHLLLGHFLGG